MDDDSIHRRRWQCCSIGKSSESQPLTGSCVAAQSAGRGAWLLQRDPVEFLQGVTTGEADDEMINIRIAARVAAKQAKILLRQIVP